MLLTAVWALQEVSPWDVSGVEAAVQRVSSFWEWPVREVTRPMFAALMGRPVGRPLYESIVLLDIDLTRARLQAAVGVLGGSLQEKGAGPGEGVVFRGWELAPEARSQGHGVMCVCPGELAIGESELPNP